MAYGVSNNLPVLYPPALVANLVVPDKCDITDNCIRVWYFSLPYPAIETRKRTATTDDGLKTFGFTGANAPAFYLHSFMHPEFYFTE